MPNEKEKCGWFDIGDPIWDDEPKVEICNNEAIYDTCKGYRACEKHKCRCSDSLMKKKEEKENKELKIHKLYLRIAAEFAKESKDPKYKIGAVIVTPFGVLYPGYNGDEIGGTNKRDSMDTGKSGFIHAEENCIIKFDPTINKGSKLYVTYNPCKMCARRIINTKAISEVYYENEYLEDLEGINILKRSGIKCERIG